MESTAFDLILLPVVLATVGSLASFWLVALLADGVGRLVHRIRGHREVAAPRGFGERNWSFRESLADSTRKSSPLVGPKYLRRPVG